MDGHLLIDGEPVDTDERRDVTSPYDGRVVGTVAVAGVAEAERAMAIAAAALDAGPPPQHERAEALERARVLVLERAEELAQGITDEAGKPISAARTEVQRCADTLAYAAVQARTLAGSVVPMEGTASGVGKLAFTILRPKGVAVAISPFNFPLNLVAHKLAPALAAGCPVVCKPAGDTPLSALRLAAILHDAGVPGDRLQVLTGPSSEIAPVMCDHPSVGVISFTGSSQIGYQLSEDHPRVPVLLELGNTTPVIIDASADIDTAATKVAATGFGFSGQSCIAAQRVIVHTDVAAAFTDALVAATEDLGVGDPADASTVVGPVIRSDDRDRIVEWISEAVDAGAEVATGGAVRDDGVLAPTVITGATPDMKVCAEEVFGPVLAVQVVEDLDEAIAVANASRYGLQAGIFTADIDAGLAAATRLAFGGVTINESPTFRADQQPYGGMRESGNTREGPPWAIHDYVEETVVIVQRP